MEIVVGNPVWLTLVSGTLSRPKEEISWQANLCAQHQSSIKLGTCPNTYQCKRPVVHCKIISCMLRALSHEATFIGNLEATNCSACYRTTLVVHEQFLRHCLTIQEKIRWTLKCECFKVDLYKHWQPRVDRNAFSYNYTLSESRSISQPEQKNCNKIFLFLM